jgi:hypothetical protein
MNWVSVHTVFLKLNARKTIIAMQYSTPHVQIIIFIRLMTAERVVPDYKLEQWLTIFVVTTLYSSTETAYDTYE